MNESLRWKLVLGCLMIAVLEAPQTSLLVAEDLGGPYRASSELGSNAGRAGAELDLALASTEREEEGRAHERVPNTTFGAVRR